MASFMSCTLCVRAFVSAYAFFLTTVFVFVWPWQRWFLWRRTYAFIRTCSSACKHVRVAHVSACVRTATNCICVCICVCVCIAVWITYKSLCKVLFLPYLWLPSWRWSLSRKAYRIFVASWTHDHFTRSSQPCIHTQSCAPSAICSSSLQPASIADPGFLVSWKHVSLCSNDEISARYGTRSWMVQKVGLEIQSVPQWRPPFFSSLHPFPPTWLPPSHPRFLQSIFYLPTCQQAFHPIMHSSINALRVHACAHTHTPRSVPASRLEACVQEAYGVPFKYALY